MQTFPEIEKIHPSTNEHHYARLNRPSSWGCDKYLGIYAAIVHRMFPANIKREIMNGVKQIFISYKVADAK